MIPCTKIIKGQGPVHHKQQTGPLVVWNITDKCNLKCNHCYRNSGAANPESAVSNEKSIHLISEIKKLNPPMVILSGGEPLLRKNVFAIMEKCKEAGLKTGLSTNGTLIDEDMAKKIKEIGIDYVGISIDGREIFHDEFRGLKGAFALSWNAIAYLNCLGVKSGVRFTLTNNNHTDLFYILDKTFKSGAKRFCLYHLVYCGRAGIAMDLPAPEKEKIMNDFFSRAETLCLINADFEILTADNPADAIYMMTKTPGNNEAAINRLKGQGGCPAGEKVIYLDSTGEVYPCQFLRDESLGNVTKRPLSDIWNDNGNHLLKKLRNKTGFLKGRCGRCAYKEICQGCRSRAKASTGSLWDQDPACYLTDVESPYNGLSRCFQRQA